MQASSSGTGARYGLIFGLTNLVLILFVGGMIWATGMFDDIGFDLHGWIAVTLGVVVTSALGTGLMALVFYSDRSRRDSEAHWVADEDRRG